MMRPYTAVLNVGGRKSLKAIPLVPVVKNSRREMGSTKVLLSQPMRMPQKSAASVNRGSMAMQARTRVATRYL